MPPDHPQHNDHSKRIMARTEAAAQADFQAAPLVSLALLEYLREKFANPISGGALAVSLDGAVEMVSRVSDYHGQCSVIEHLQQIFDHQGGK